MISISKSNKPEILEQNDADWTNELMEKINNGEEIPKSLKERYRHSQIKDAVVEETSGKCCYCESNVSHVYPGDIEHIKPKSIFPNLTFDWDNLTFVCSKCNNKKRDYYSLNGGVNIINPYIENPLSHLYSFGPMIMHINNSKVGEFTWKKLDLNRMPLIEKRKEKIESIQTLIDKYNRENDEALKELLKQELLEYAEQNSEFSMTVKNYLKEQGIE